MPREAPSVAELLRAAIDQAGIPIRELARVLAGPDANDERVEAWRRSIHKYLDGTTPSRPRAILIARALGQPDGYLIRPRPRRTDPIEETLQEVLARLRELDQRVQALEEPRPRR